MKQFNLFLLVVLTSLLSSCELAGSIFKGGVWTGAILVILVIAAIIYAISRSSSRK